MRTVLKTLGLAVYAVSLSFMAVYLTISLLTP
jgi:hypothetical protein